MGVYIGAWYLLQDIFANRGLRREWLVDALLIAGVPVVFVGYAQVEVALTGGLPLPRPVGTLGNANALAAFLVMLIPFALGAFAAAKSPGARTARAFYGVMALALLMLSFSRGGWIGTGVALAVWVDLRFPVRRIWTALPRAASKSVLIVERLQRRLVVAFVLVDVARHRRAQARTAHLAIPYGDPVVRAAPADRARLVHLRRGAFAAEFAAAAGAAQPRPQRHPARRRRAGHRRRSRWR